MMLRTFRFRVPKKNERKMVVPQSGTAGVLRRPRDMARRLLQRIPACRAAYFVRNQARKNEYMWVTLWTSDAARERVMRRKDWKNVATREEKAGFFSGRPRHVHYDVVLRLGRREQP